MRWRAERLIALLALRVTTLAAQEAEQPQLGLRLDSRSSMQWHGDTLLLEGSDRTFMRVPGREIQDVWPGPVRGSFAVTTPNGVGILFGSSIVPGGWPVERDAILRSSRPDVMWACVSDASGRPRRRIIELRSGGRQRELVLFDRAVRDFDVDVAGRVAALMTDGTLLFAASAGTAPVLVATPASQAPPRRVFIDAGGTELALYGRGSLLRRETSSGAWTAQPFSERTDALVRHAVSRRMRIEPRFAPASR